MADAPELDAAAYAPQHYPICEGIQVSFIKGRLHCSKMKPAIQWDGSSRLWALFGC